MFTEIERPFTITALGTGNAFTIKNRQSNFAITCAGKTLLVDCGSDIRHSITPDKVDAVYISHLHGDHYHGLEYLGFSTYYNPNLKRPKLYVPGSKYGSYYLGMVSDLWEHGLKASMGEQGTKTIDDYFEVIPISSRFEWNHIQFKVVERPHTDTEVSYGLWLNDQEIYFTSDVKFEYSKNIDMYYKSAKIIFHDVETSPFESSVHPHYTKLETLPQDIRSKIKLYHYHDNVLDEPEKWESWATKYGFDIVKPNQSFMFHVKHYDI